MSAIAGAGKTFVRSHTEIVITTIPLAAPMPTIF
jgi:hypothetical protein